MLSTFTDLVINHPSSNSLLLEHRLIPLLRSPLAFRCRGFAEPRRFFRFREQHHYYYCYFRALESDLGTRAQWAYERGRDINLRR